MNASTRRLFDQEIFTEPEEIRQSSNIGYVCVFVSNRAQNDVHITIIEFLYYIYSTFVSRFFTTYQIPNIHVF